eukprot:scaffold130346_cov42-Phaeocystis_antarctica.AAC.1
MDSSAPSAVSPGQNHSPRVGVRARVKVRVRVRVRVPCPRHTRRCCKGQVRVRASTRPTVSAGQSPRRATPSARRRGTSPSRHLRGGGG